MGSHKFYTQGYYHHNLDKAHRMDSVVVDTVVATAEPVAVVDASAVALELAAVEVDLSRKP